MASLPEPDPIAADRRRARRSHKVGENAACVLCGTTNPDALTLRAATLLEAQHVLGEQAAPEAVVALCRNCHAVATAAQHDMKALPPPGPRNQEDSGLDALHRVLSSLAIFLHDLAHTLLVIVPWLVDLCRHLDSFAPTWRDQPWAQLPRTGWTS